jgi:hypothetical protein
MRRWKDTVLLYPRQYWYVINKTSAPEKLLFGVFHRVIKKGDKKATTFKHEWEITEIELHTDDQGVDYAKVFDFFFFFFLSKLKFRKWIQSDPERIFVYDSYDVVFF